MRRIRPGLRTLFAASSVLLGATGDLPPAASTAAAGSLYLLQRPYVDRGEDFFSSFWFCEAGDPRNGHVVYMNQTMSDSLGLVHSREDHSRKDIIIGADTKSNASGFARPSSVRLLSRSTYSAGLFVLRVTHVPTGCGVWPAFKFYGGRALEECLHGKGRDSVWSAWDEVDIVEGVHEASRTATTLHTSFVCDQAGLVADPRARGIRWRKGEFKQADNCRYNAGGQWRNQGCSQEGPPDSLGQKINDGGGGTYAAELDPAGEQIRAWFWASGSEPADLREGSELRPDGWEQPFAYFRLGPLNCPADNFQKLHLAFDINFCGDYGSPTFKASCPGKLEATCEEFVSKNPEAFKEAFWSFHRLDVYQKLRAEEDAATATVDAAGDAAPAEASRGSGGWWGGLEEEHRGRGGVTSNETATTTSAVDVWDNFTMLHAGATEQMLSVATATLLMMAVPVLLLVAAACILLAKGWVCRPKELADIANGEAAGRDREAPPPEDPAEQKLLDEDREIPLEGFSRGSRSITLGRARAVQCLSEERPREGTRRGWPGARLLGF